MALSGRQIERVIVSIARHLLNVRRARCLLIHLRDMIYNNNTMTTTVQIEFRLIIALSAYRTRPNYYKRQFTRVRISFNSKTRIYRLLRKRLLIA